MAHRTLTGNTGLSDERLIFVQNIDIRTTRVELEDLFCDCGPVDKLIIRKGRFNGQCGSVALIEFSDAASVKTALTKSGFIFRGRRMAVSAAMCHMFSKP